ncbi:hypothetical protein CVD25_08600 [Bacillus canaveralius]|uniref:DNA-binding response regulator n=1 Tax=Bacillus canaveralius TaxID=1403243 RepID=A0A2N5GL15_9BACI|nr:response regulator transcription factor [Bacillus canaveralius]PLR82217.1 hypothetical protein CU635_13740 [Bacillus canaveralius]PLR97877.1 hypothetical protein CVD25_08600 [Bacillus canaveralius]
MNLMIVDDHEIVREGLAMLMEQSFCIDAVYFASEGREALRLATNYPVDLVLLDLSMPGGLDGLSVIGKLKNLLSDAKVVVFSMYGDIRHQKKAFECGADGFLVKQLKRKELIQSIDQILANHKVFNEQVFSGDTESRSQSVVPLDLPITNREREVFILTVKGFTQKDIAEKLHISIKTVENHRAVFVKN